MKLVISNIILASAVAFLCFAFAMIDAEWWHLFAAGAWAPIHRLAAEYA